MYQKTTKQAKFHQLSHIIGDQLHTVLWGPTSTYHVKLCHNCVKCLYSFKQIKASLTHRDITPVMFWHISYQRWKQTQLHNYRLIQKSLPAQAKKLIATNCDITASRNKQHMKCDKRLVMMVSSFHSQTATYTAKSDRWHF